MRPRSPHASAYAWNVNREVLHPHQLRGRGGQPKANVSGDARRAQEEANHDAAAQEDDGETEEVPEEDDMDTQGYTSGYRKIAVGITATLIWHHGIS